MQNGIRIAHSCKSTARTAAREFYAGAKQRETALVVFFCSSAYALPELAEELQILFEDVPLVGCTTAGEIWPGGYQDGIAGVSFSAQVCSAVTGQIGDLQRFQISAGQALSRRLWQELKEKNPSANVHNSFALLLIDGLSVREECVARALQNGLGEVPLVGGSAGDGLNFSRTQVYANGEFASNTALMALMSTPLPCTVFKTQHFVPTNQRMVITKADPGQRKVMEVNGLPAASEYARLIGVHVDDLTPGYFAAAPVVVLIDGNSYVRSIQKAETDGSVTFYCAIEEGVVLRIAHGVDLVENLNHTFDGICAQIGSPQLVLGFDCILRKLEISANHLETKISDIFGRNNVVGFNTYGEQFRGVHVNQTLTGVALGSNPGDVLDA